ncbi:MAG TPA: TM0106 family RecB-like putative nuclease [Casimicrobiaceae bacterium]|nr:TM0106 family RecB-like putative nuclease [Casimicrobiaceae bacterium]
MLNRNGRILLSPSDLNDFVECGHRTTLARQVALGERAKPHVADEGAKLLADKGMAHELEFLARMRDDGRDVVEISIGENWDFETAAAHTVTAMRAGADVIAQATFVDGRWRGRADFLLKKAGSSNLGAWRYEALDAKLARAEKPTYVLQLCFYSNGIASVQGTLPEHMHVFLGVGQTRTLRYDDFSAYYRRVRGRFESALTSPAATEAYPVEHCALCEFRAVCHDQWRAEDSLVFVAGMRRAQVAGLRESRLPTLAALAKAAPGTKVVNVEAHAFEKLRDQAALQLDRRVSGRLDWHRIDAEAGHGFEQLPRPSPGDVIFDIEGDPFWEPAQGLHFLFGILVRDGDEWQYRPMWAHDRADERRMFENFVDLVHARLAADPAMHVYHYGTYENAALKQLMGTYATREDAVDELLRRGVLVNLHTVVRQGLRAGVESYSLKEVESLVPYARKAEVRSGMGAVLAYEQWMSARDDAALASIADYNEDDCRATLALRDWLIAKHPDDLRWFDPRASEDNEEAQQAAGARAELRQRLVEGEEPGSARWLAGELLEYHQREARPVWWWFFERSDHMTADELLEDGESIADLEVDGAAVADKRSLVYPLKFPVQQHKFRPGDTPSDPATKKSAGTIVALDDIAGTLTLKRGPSLKDVPLPRALIPDGPYQTKAQRDALARLAQSMLANDSRYPALRDILSRTPPRVRGREDGHDIQTIDIAAQRALTLALDSSYLFIQGPPGTGKTWTGARLITELMRHGRRVGVTATSHKAIHNLLDEVERAAKDEGLQFRGLKKSSGDNAESLYDSPSIASADANRDFAGAGPDTLLFAGTAWLFAHPDLDQSVDTLIIDEAGQVSLADALAMGTAGRNVVLLGDPLQLAQVSQGAHPIGTGASVLEHLLGEEATVPAQRGLFLECTRRMHPDVCRFVSEIVYDSRLQGIPELERMATAFGTGLRFVPVAHAGNAAASAEEAAEVAARIAAMIGTPWTDRDGKAKPLQPSDFMVVAPYNAQVRKLREALLKAGLPSVPVGTVDKFQGREAAIVFYSMATSSLDDIPRSLEFLFSRNRLNVAVSRAMCLAVIVASPRLLEAHARTIDQMRLVNALCRFVEIAGGQPPFPA